MNEVQVGGFSCIRDRAPGPTEVLRVLIVWNDAFFDRLFELCIKEWASQVILLASPIALLLPRATPVLVGPGVLFCVFQKPSFVNSSAIEDCCRTKSFLLGLNRILG